ncbi:MAG: C/D box methylation guide ribonucleoprotein complex aNOP56 subunit [Candidatus Thorarchaeota archaeon]|nr:MAG: C/D box methylation guide ribonucleoprotein complex aNOP56 subunit [Candidatus Thorarchaeota archaeon]
MTFPDVELAAENMMSISNGTPTDQLKEIASTLAIFPENEVAVDDRALARALAELIGHPIRIESDCQPIKWFRSSQDEILASRGDIGTREEISSFRRAVALRLAGQKISTASEEKDLLVKHAIDAIDEIDKAINLVSMRLREWYTLYHPTLSLLIADHEIFARTVSSHVNKTELTKDGLLEAGVPESTTKAILEGLDDDIGASLSESDLEVIQLIAAEVVRQYNLRKDLEEYVTSLMEKVAPNVTALVGPIVGARLISRAGSLGELAAKPSSTIQVFGAEKALFRSIKTGTDPPKHGIIYQVPDIRSAPYWQRGKIARSLAGKLAIASRIDAYSKRDAGESLRRDFEKRVEEIRRQNPEAPPPKPSKKPKHHPERKQKQRKGTRKKTRGRK